MVNKVIQEIWANAHKTRDSISLISYAGCLGLFPVISAKIHSKCASQPNIAKKFTKNPYFGVQGRSRLSMLVPPKSPSAVLVMISCKSVSICNPSHARTANSGKITINFRGATPLWCPHSRGIYSPSGTKLPHKKLETLGYHMVKTRSLYIIWAWIRTGSCQTDKRTHRQT